MANNKEFLKHVLEMTRENEKGKIYARESTMAAIAALKTTNPELYYDLSGAYGIEPVRVRIVVRKPQRVFRATGTKQKRAV